MHGLIRDRGIWVAVGILAGLLLLFELTDLDLRVQDRLYDFGCQAWMVDGNNPTGRLWFYNGPKALVWLTGLALLVLAFGPARWRDRWQLNRRGLGVAVLTLATLPALAGLGKNLTDVFCPSEVRRYGGAEPYVKLCAPYAPGDLPAGKGHCFPAGHATGGFALMGLACLRASRRWRNGAIILGLAAGWWMGGYQMLKGAHYLSHTLVTMALAGLVMRVWLAVLRPPRAD